MRGVGDIDPNTGDRIIGYYKRRDKKNTMTTHPITTPVGTRFKPTAVNVFKIRRYPEKSIFAVQVKPGSEASVARQLEERLFENPDISSILFVEGLGGLVFVQADNRYQVRDALRGVRGRRFVMDGVVKDKELAEYIDRKIGILTPLVVNDYVDIIAGPFKDMEAQVLETVPNREEIKVMLIGPDSSQNIPVILKTDMVSKIIQKKEETKVEKLVDVGDERRRDEVKKLFEEAKIKRQEEAQRKLSAPKLRKSHAPGTPRMKKDAKVFIKGDIPNELNKITRVARWLDNASWYEGDIAFSPGGKGGELVRIKMPNVKVGIKYHTPYDAVNIREWLDKALDHKYNVRFDKNTMEYEVHRK